MDRLGIITYDAKHLKTEQILLRLVGQYDIKVYALPYVQRPLRQVRFRHRPEQSAAAHPGDICQRYGLPYISVESDSQIDNDCELYLLTGAGILSAECLKGKRVLNAHPGVIPAVRGLDAFKWSIYNMLPIGVTLHYIDEQVDVGEIVSVIPTPVFFSDTLEMLARRHYENEIEIFAHFTKHLAYPQNPFAGIPRGESMRRMKAEQEAELPKQFEQYKQEVLYLNERTFDRQMSGGGTLRASLTCISTPPDLRKAAA